MNYRNRREKSARQAAWWAAGGVAIALVVFIIGSIALMVILETGAYDPMFEGLHWFFDWEYAGVASLLALIGGLMAALRGWRWLREADALDAKREREAIPDSSRPDDV